MPSLQAAVGDSPVRMYSTTIQLRQTFGQGEREGGREGVIGRVREREGGGR
jgi:hypothetical protein